MRVNLSTSMVLLKEKLRKEGRKETKIPFNSKLYSGKLFLKPVNIVSSHKKVLKYIKNHFRFVYEVEVRGMSSRCFQ